jgi:hypothetical protein
MPREWVRVVVELSQGGPLKVVMITNVDEILGSTEGGRWLKSFKASFLEWVGPNEFIVLPLAIIGAINRFEWD